MKVLITGSEGQLGRDLTAVLSGHELYPFDMDLDITQADSVMARVADIKPDIILHCAAMTNVDGCEENPDMAYAVNAIGAGNVALAARKTGASMVYVSTDFVFDGTKKTPYNEFDAVNPLSVYGRSKLAGEMFVERFLPEAYIVRTAWLYGRIGHNFVKTMLRLAAEKDEIGVVNDQSGSPTFSLDLANRIAELMETGWYGTYHATNSGETTWYDFARAILKNGGFDPEKIKPISSAELNRPAPRPAYSVLDNSAARIRGLKPMRQWEDALADYFKGQAK
jgi:dTDP-4-dehydrorhamnose reductase